MKNIKNFNIFLNEGNLFNIDNLEFNNEEVKEIRKTIKEFKKNRHCRKDKNSTLELFELLNNMFDNTLIKICKGYFYLWEGEDGDDGEIYEEDGMITYWIEIPRLNLLIDIYTYSDTEIKRLDDLLFDGEGGYQEISYKSNVKKEKPRKAEPVEPTNQINKPRKAELVKPFVQVEKPLNRKKYQIDDSTWDNYQYKKNYKRL